MHYGTGGYPFHTITAMALSRGLVLSRTAVKEFHTMKSLLSLVAVTMLVVTPGLRADDKKEDSKDAKKKDNISSKLVGTWEVVKATDEVAVGATVIFKKDGKFTFRLKVNDQEFTIDGTYKVEDGKLHTVAAFNGEEHSDVDTFEKLTDDEIELKSTNDGKITVLKRKKG
jgi:uncharacterized protein (TIGR03066 family)